jgi:uncharacterized membrane protein
MNAKQRELACHRLLDKYTLENEELRKQLANAREALSNTRGLIGGAMMNFSRIRNPNGMALLDLAIKATKESP